MDKQRQLEYLRSKYIQLSRQYLQQLQGGNTVSDLKDLAELIASLIKEMDVMEELINKENEAVSGG